MGLDMYLTRKKYIGGQYGYREVEGEINIKIKGVKMPIDLKKVEYIEEEVAYWRKANQIHKWFVNNVQDGEDDCKPYYVSAENLKTLLALCKEVIKTAKITDGQIKVGESLKGGKWVANYKDGKIIENAEEIAKILPTQEGFFFGSADYDEYYLQDIKYTIETLEKILEEEKELNKLGFYSDFEYRASW